MEKLRHGRDRGLASIFSHPKMITSIIKTFVPEDWVQSLDFSSLSPMNIRYITEHLRERENDMLWKIRANDKWLYLMFHLEFQTTNETFMAVRTLTYCGLIYENLIKNEKQDLVNGKLPPVFSLVYYTGATPWRAPSLFKECLSELIPPNLMQYQLNGSYIPLDIGRLPLDIYANNEDNLVLLLIELERANSTDGLIATMENVAKQLAKESESLIRAFGEYINNVLMLPSKYSIKTLEDLRRTSMLREWVAEQQREFHHEGREEKCREMFYKALKKQLDLNASSPIPPEIDAIVKNASENQIELWYDKILDGVHIMDELLVRDLSR